MPKTCFFLPEQCLSCPTLSPFVHYVSFILVLFVSQSHGAASSVVVQILQHIPCPSFFYFKMVHLFIHSHYFRSPPVLYHDILHFCIWFCISTVKPLLFVPKPTVGHVSQLRRREFSLFHFFFSHPRTFVHLLRYCGTACPPWFLFPDFTFYAIQMVIIHLDRQPILR